MNEIITAVELATSKVSVAVGKKEGDKVTIISHKVTPLSRGIRHGEVENAHKVIDALQSTIKETEEYIGEPISDIVLCTSSQFVRCEKYTLHKERANYSNFITQSEVSVWQKETLRLPVGEDEIILDAIPQSFNIDDVIGIHPTEIVGMKGKRVEGFYMLIIGKRNSTENKIDVVQKCDLNVVNTTLSAIGSARVALNKNEIENGVALLDIGAGLTDVVIVKNNIVQEIGTIPFAGQSITDDIKNVACITSDAAELIKVKYGSCIEDGINESKKLIIKGTGGSENSEVQLTLLASVINARLCEILEAATYIIDKAGYSNKIPAGIVITGGTCYMENIKDLGRAITGHNVRLANALGSISDSSEDTCFDTYSTSIVGAVVCNFDESHTNKQPVREFLKEIDPAPPKSNNIFGWKDESKIKQQKKEVKKTKPQPKEEKKSEPKKGGFFTDLFSGNLNNGV